MELIGKADTGFYLTKNRQGYGLFLCLYDTEFFRGIYKRNTLPKRPKCDECAIVNLDSTTNNGTHWVAYINIANVVQYSDSFGNLESPSELAAYFGRDVEIFYNNDSCQTYNQTNCGHLCLKFLFKNFSKIYNIYSAN